MTALLVSVSPGIAVISTLAWYSMKHAAVS